MSCFPARSGVGSVVNTGQMLEIKVGVDLGGGDVRVAEQLLDGAQVAAGLEQVGGEGVPEQVGIYVQRDSLAPRPVRHPRLYRAWSETPSATPDEECGDFRAGELRTLGVPGAERGERHLADRDDPHLAALAEHAHRAILEVD